MKEPWMDDDLYQVDNDYRSKLLVEFGFLNKKAKEEDKYVYNEKKKVYVPKEGNKLEAKDAGEEVVEVNFRGEYGKTGFPATPKSYKLVWEVFDLSLEEPYFWILDSIKGSFTIVEKLEDTFSAAENSAFFGVTQQRLGAQQDKISQLLATVGKMIKELFQMVRELRILDEKLSYYDKVKEQLAKPMDERGKADDITLKGFFVDLVQQGAKSPASVFGMARELEFITLPDLFFDSPPFGKVSELENYVQALEKDFNQNVLRVLLRHLRQYMEWRDRTHQEMHVRRTFMIKYLEQHYQIISMYINWIKPYLRHVARLTMKEQNMSSPDILSSFEGSMLDIELLCRKRNSDTETNSCLLLTYHYRTRPEMKVVQEGYQRGPVHIGRMELQIRTYAWTDKQVENYKNLKKKETYVLMGEISISIKEAMDALGEDLEKYLDEARGDTDKKKEDEENPPEEKSFAEKFFGDFYTPKKVKPKKGPSRKYEKEKDEKQKEALKDDEKGAKGAAWTLFKNFKKAHKMLAW